MNIVYAREKFPETVNKTIFLAGPSPRDQSHYNWRIEALELLKQSGYDGHVFIPLPRNGQFPSGYDEQVAWEQAGMNRSDVILFWVPRDLATLPAFTTNVEFGQKCRNHNVVLGYPKEAPKCRFLGYLAEQNFIEYADTLEQTIEIALKMIGDGAKRVGGECEVPLFLWRTPHFQSWLQAQNTAGNRLDGCKVELAFGVGPRKAFLFYWAAHVNIYIKAENRNKENEIVIGRPDIKHVVGFAPFSVSTILDAEVVLIREFRSPSATADGFIREMPGGSSFKPAAPEIDAAKEFEEETGIPMSPDRLQPLAARQLSGTSTSHKAHVFYVMLTIEEVVEAERKQREKTHQGNIIETEQTYVEVRTIRELLAEPLTDWSNLGMLFAAIAQECNI